MKLPAGFFVRPLVRHTHERGSLFEMSRASWGALPPAVQWNVVDSEPDVMRGMHAHLAYDEYYCVMAGRMRFGLRDTRPGSPTEGLTAMVDLDADEPKLMGIPSGIMHGVHALTRARLLVGLSCEWDGTREIGCLWTDPALGLDWRLDRVILSEQDAALPRLCDVQAEIPPYRGGEP